MLQNEKERKFQENGKSEVMRKKHDYSEKRKKRIRSAIMRTGLLAMLLIVSTYAWFTSQKDITLSNLRGTVEVQENMEISLDAKTWHQKIDLSDAAKVFKDAQDSRDDALSESEGSRTTAIALLPNQLLPVSGVGEKNDKLMPLYTGKATSTSLSDIVKCDEVDASGKAKDNGYFAFDIYIKNTSQDGEDDVLQLNLNSAVQVLQNTFSKIETDGTNVTRTDYIGDAASGLQNTVRVGLALYEGREEATATQKQILDATKGTNIEDIAIWEPNASDHVEYIVSNNNKLIGNDVNGAEKAIEFGPSEQVKTYALKAAAAVTPDNKIENVYDIRNAKLGLQKTFKTEKKSSADYRINAESPLNIKNIEEADFKIKSNAVSRIRVYVWLEGQDVDCINVASQGGGIELDLGLTKDGEVGEVLTEEEEPLAMNVSYAAVNGDEVKVTVRSEKDLTLPDENWNYEEVVQGAKAGEVYRVAAVEPVVLGATTLNKKAMYRIYDADVTENIVVRSADGTENILQFAIKNVESGNPSMLQTKYDKVEETTGEVKVTVESDTEITSLPSGWTYVDESTKTEITKVYTENKTETVSVTNEAGTTSIEVKVENIKEPTFAEIVKSNPTTYYGKQTDYPFDIDNNTETDDWSIFYSDGNNVFLIADDNVLNSKIISVSDLGMTENGNYSVSWDDFKCTFPTIDNNSKYLISRVDDFSSSNGNYYTTASLFDLDKWKNFVDINNNGNIEDDLAESAIGTPTVEMWVASWNEKGYTKLKIENDNIGYYIGKDGNNLKEIANQNDSSKGGYRISISNEDGHDDLLYFPHQDSIDSNFCTGYWLASPSAYDEDEFANDMMAVGFSGGIYDYLCVSGGCGVRPVICLKPSVTAVQDEGVWKLEI